VDPELVVMESQEEGKYMLAMFNLSDDEKSVSIPRDLSSLEQLEWSFKERILEDGFQGSGNTIKFPSMPPHSSRIWILK